MKKSNVIFGLSIIGLLIMSSCKKVAGPGGTSSITGNVSGLNIDNSGNPAEQEVTYVFCTHANGVDGSILDNSDYFLLNTPNGGTNYYVWYENTNWLGQDPGLSGRTGIKVTYSNAQSNTTIASNTANAISSIAGSDFSVAVSNDILTITNNQTGEVPDADEVNTPFLIDIQNQGKSASIGVPASFESPMAEERVYIIYGDEDFYSETVRTDANGDYQFRGLTKGSYRIFAFSIDTLSSLEMVVQQEVSTEITKNKEVVSAPDIYIVK